ncbi:MAG: hypothetical protein WA117_24530 [Verrucomicrobiia bacterium]
MTIELGNDLNTEKFVSILGNVLMQSMNESVVLAQLEGYKLFRPMPAPIPLGEGTPLEAKLDELSVALGGPPRTLVTKERDNPARYDTYVDAAITEIVSAFLRARTSVCRTHLYFIGSSSIKLHPEWMHLPEDPNIRRILIERVETCFWEHAETSCIRLASFWDRMGQLLDFTFFNIRQYERDGFPSVLDRIRTNVLPMSPILRNSDAWSRIRKYQTSEEAVGLKWLLRRRNLLVHSLHLSPMSENHEDQIFTSAYNHLEENVKEKLRPGDKEWELNQMHEHLNAAVSLFMDTVDLALLGVSVACRA